MSSQENFSLSSISFKHIAHVRGPSLRISSFCTSLEGGRKERRIDSSVMIRSILVLIKLKRRSERKVRSGIDSCFNIGESKIKKEIDKW